MKKKISVILIAVTILMMVLTACGERNTQPMSPAIESGEQEAGNETEDQSENIDSTMEVQPEYPVSETELQEETEQQNEAENDGHQTLVAYFSNTGNTREVAELIAEYTGGDLDEIRRSIPYEDLNEEAKVEIEDGIRPDIVTDITDVAVYDVIFVGYPIWWDEAPAMIASFLENNDFSNKTIVPFCTSASDTIDNSLHIFDEICPDAVIAEGLTANNTDDIVPWLQQLGYGEESVFDGISVTITADGETFQAVLDESETAKAFADMLPISLSMQRVGGGREFYGSMNSGLPYDNAAVQTEFENGDIAFWLGGDGLCLLYNNQVDNPEISQGIIVFGKVISELDAFFDMNDNIEVTVELEH